MNTKHLLALGAALLLAPITATLAQSAWETVDNATPAAGRDIVADPDGNFIGLDLDYTTTNAITAVVRSTNHGASWETVGSIGGYALDLAAAAPDGALFACGNRSLTVSGRAFVWQSLDHGVSWTEINPWVGQTGTFLCMDVAAGNTDSIYVCGYVGTRWVVRKGQRTPGGGISWTTVDDIPGTQPDSICVRPAATPGQADEILVCGLAASNWTARRSVNGGASWATVDSYSTGMQRGYSGVATGPDDSIYVVGRIATTTYVTNQTVVKKKVVTTVTTTTEYGWLVRKSANGGASWANVDYFVNGWPGNAPITVDALGRIFVAGFDNTTAYKWLVRGSSDGGATWITTDLFTPAGATTSQAWGVTSDASGNICVIGEANMGTSKMAPIRRLAAP